VVTWVTCILQTPPGSQTTPARPASGNAHERANNQKWTPPASKSKNPDFTFLRAYDRIRHVRQMDESLTEIIEESRSKDPKWSAKAGRRNGATRLLSRFFVSVVSGNASILHVAP
jgi:hypothetical protein